MKINGTLDSSGDGRSQSMTQDLMTKSSKAGSSINSR